jgi:hypothetical protein
MKQKAVKRKKINAASRTDETSFLKSEATIFINYRRDDTKDEAAYLRALLARQFGVEKIFRDLDSIKLGTNFPEVINKTLDDANVILVLIGKKWLTIKKRGHPRIKAKNDYVRIEIETALKLRKPIIPILLNGASMPLKAQLPVSIVRLSTINAVGLSWFEGSAKITSSIKELEKQIKTKQEKEDEKRKNLSLEFTNTPFKKNKKSSGKEVIVTAMEYSLSRYGKKIGLDAKDFYDTLSHYEENAELKKYGGFFYEDMIYVIDFIGIKAKTGNKRYVARSMPLKSISDVPAQLTLKRPVMCGFIMYEDWFDKNVSRTGMIDFDKPKGGYTGSTVGVIISWNPVSETISLLTPWPNWGKKGMATISKNAMYHIETKYLRAIEAVEKSPPLSESLLKLSNRMAPGNKKNKK